MIKREEDLESKVEKKLKSLLYNMTFDSYVSRRSGSSSPSQSSPPLKRMSTIDHLDQQESELKTNGGRP